MASVEDLVNKANAKNKNFNKEEKKNTEVIEEKAGAVSKYSFRRDDEDSPTSLFTNEAVESSTMQSVTRLMKMWESQSQERDQNFLQPDDYVENANKIFSSYQGIRFKIDSAVAFLIGDILNECRIKFFNDEKKAGKQWLHFLKEKITFSQRQAYDFMSISSKLSYIRGKNLTMEQFRALLSLHSSGFEIHKIPENIESLSPSLILSLKEENKENDKEIKKISRVKSLTMLLPVVSKLENMVAEFDSLPLNSIENKNKKEKDYILSVKVKLENILSLINKNIFNEV